MRKTHFSRIIIPLLDLKRKHHDVVIAERTAYYPKQQLAIRDPDDYLYLIIDGADQSAYSLPYFVEKFKILSSKPKMKHKLHGVIAHGIGSWLYAVPMNAGNGCNLTIETLHRVLSDIKMQESFKFLRAYICSWTTVPERTRTIISWGTCLCSWNGGCSKRSRLAISLYVTLMRILTRCFLDLP